MTESQLQARDEVEKSLQAIREIVELRDSPAFQAYRVKIERKAEEMSKAVLEGSIPPEEREAIRLQRVGLLSGLRMLDSDMDGHLSILRSHGVEV